MKKIIFSLVFFLVSSCSSSQKFDKNNPCLNFPISDERVCFVSKTAIYKEDKITINVLDFLNRIAPSKYKDIRLIECYRNVNLILFAKADTSIDLISIDIKSKTFVCINKYAHGEYEIGDLLFEKTDKLSQLPSKAGFISFLIYDDVCSNPQYKFEIDVTTNTVAIDNYESKFNEIFFYNYCNNYIDVRLNQPILFNKENSEFVTLAKNIPASIPLYRTCEFGHTNYFVNDGTLYFVECVYSHLYHGNFEKVRTHYLIFTINFEKLSFDYFGYSYNYPQGIYYI